MEIISCIYIIKSIIKPDIAYVGSTVNLAARQRRHCSDLKLIKHTNERLQAHVNEYGLDDLYFDVLEKVPQKNKLIEREQFYIDTLTPSFNICKVAGSVLGYKMSEKEIEANRLRALGNKHALGHRKSERSKKQHSEFMKGKKYNLGKRRSDEYKKSCSERMKKRLNGAPIYIQTEAHKAKARERCLGEKGTKAKKVIDISTGKIFGCIKYAAEYLNINHGTMRNMLNGANKNKTTIRYYDATR